MISLPSIRCILQWQFSGVPLRVGMDLPALQFFLRITYVSLLTSMTEYLCSKDPDALRKWKFFASVLLCFHFGVIVSYLSCKNFGHTGSLVCFLPVFSGFCLVWARKHFVAVKHFVYHYLSHQRKVQLILQKVSNYGKFNL